jgi:hypothetical protein
MQAGAPEGRIISLLLCGILILTFSSGCIEPTNINPDSYSVPTTDAGIPGNGTGSTVQPAPTATTLQGSVSVTASQSAGPGTSESLFTPGSIVQKDIADPTFDRDREWIVIRVNEDGTYTVGQIYYDRMGAVWFRVKEELTVIRPWHAVERDYPVVKGTIVWDSVPVKHAVTDESGKTTLQW